MKSRKRILGSARASRADCGASPQSDFLRLRASLSNPEKFAMPRAASPAREARALPRLCRQHHWLALAFCIVVFLGCETANYAPVVTASRKAEVTKLERGRDLFVHRCIECHTLPAIWKYSRKAWPEIVNDMSHRASLKPDDRDAVIAYILAVRASQR